MPRGNPKTPTALRLDPALVAEVRQLTDNLTEAIEDGLRLWLLRERRRQAHREKREPVR